MRDISTGQITDTVARLCVDANIVAAFDVVAALERARTNDPGGAAVLDTLLRNAQIAREDRLPICQDTGMAVVFIGLGQEVHITGGALTDAVNEGVRRGYRDGYLRYSVVRDPVRRENTGDNTPAVIHIGVVPGDTLSIAVAPKGFGSENMSALAMLKPSDGLAGVEDFVASTVQKAGSNPCPPVVVGVGVGGTFESAALLAKRALLRPVGDLNPDPFWRESEQRLLERVNRLGIGPGGFGGVTTALAVHIIPAPTHIAGLPVAVNIGCHVTRHRTEVL